MLCVYCRRVSTECPYYSSWRPDTVNANCNEAHTKYCILLGPDAGAALPFLRLREDGTPLRVERGDGVSKRKVFYFISIIRIIKNMGIDSRELCLTTKYSVYDIAVFKLIRSLSLLPNVCGECLWRALLPALTF